MRKNMKTKLWILAGIALCGFAGNAMATPMGTLNIANCSGGGITVSATTIVFTPATGGGTGGCIDTGLGTALTYSGGSLGGGIVGNILNLTAGGGAVNNFMTFTGTPLDFTLTGLGPASSTPCSGAITLNQTCSAPGSPFVLTDLGANTGISLTATGTASDGVGPSSNWTGAFTSQITGETIAQILNTISTGGSIQSTHSASFSVTSVPEPMTLSMMGIGLLGLGLIARRRKV
jgi:hypothetical protein